MASLERSLIDDLERVITAKNISDRAAMLRRVTDLFVAASGRLSDEQIELFDDVMGRLLEEIETSARSTYGHLLATLPDAPPRTVRQLALDDAIDVAAPVLEHSERLDQSTLVEGARTKSQAHLLAISRRRTLSPVVTDILVERGDGQVALSTVRNPGAAFSDSGFATLVQRSSIDDNLAMCIWARPEIPRQHLLKLFADSSEAVRLRLTNRDPSKARLILEIVAQASHQIQVRTRERSSDFAVAERLVRSLHQKGGLNEAQLAKFARADRFDETTVALSLICDLPITLIERAFIDDGAEQIIIMTRAAGLSWDTLKALLQLQAKTKDRPPPSSDLMFEAFARLKVETARKAIQFFRLRDRASGAPPH